MGITVHNNSAQNVDVWSSVGGGPIHYNNNTQKGEETVFGTDWVWYTIHAKVNTGKDDEITDGQVAIGLLAPLAGLGFGAFVAGVVAGAVSLLQNSGAAGSLPILPERMKEYIDAEAVTILNNIDPVGVKAVYGRNNDVDVSGGDIDWTRTKIVGGSPDEGGKLEVAFYPLAITER